MKMKHILNRVMVSNPSIYGQNIDVLKKAARYWVGKDSAQLKRDAMVSALEKALKDPRAAAAAFASLDDEERLILSIVARYGTTISGDLLQAELISRGLIEPPDRGTSIGYSRQLDGGVEGLRTRMMLVQNAGAYSYQSHHYGRLYPELTLQSTLSQAVPMAAPIPWISSAPAPDAKPTLRRSSAEVALDLWHVVEALREMKTWQIVQGEMLSKGSRNKLRKLAPMTSAEDDPLAPPDPQTLYYEILHQFECLDFRTTSVKLPLLEKATSETAPVQAWRWIRAWLQMTLWQDGLGVVPDMGNREGSNRISSEKLLRSKTLLVWSLCRVATAKLDWLDLEHFLRDYWLATRNDYSHFYWGGYSWTPDFDSLPSKSGHLKGDDRIFSFWLAKEGFWAANAIMVTLVTLGFVERGHSVGKSARNCFRLTDLGQIVFGSPEIELPPATAKERFLTVQPNHEILAYLDSADASQVAMLSRFAMRTSAAGGRVQTFAIRRDTVYRGLESGLTPESIKSFLAEQGRTPVPENVTRSLSEWSSKRESLVIRRRVTLALLSEGAELPKAGSTAKELDARSLVLPTMSAKQAKQKFAGLLVLDHEAPFPKNWTADERGSICVEDLDCLSHIRLSRIAEPSEENWQITEQSITRARKQGMSGEQILSNLQLQLTHSVPPLLETAIRNWTGRTPAAYLGKVLMLQVTAPQARSAILTSPTFAPFLAGHLPPDWFLIKEDKLADVKRLLKNLGFSLGESYQSPFVEAAKSAEPAVKLHNQLGVKSR
jgi:hypothetical protein